MCKHEWVASRWCLECVKCGKWRHGKNCIGSKFKPIKTEPQQNEVQEVKSVIITKEDEIALWWRESPSEDNLVEKIIKEIVKSRIWWLEESPHLKVYSQWIIKISVSDIQCIIEKHLSSK